jgi:hypothetical protein
MPLEFVCARTLQARFDRMSVWDPGRARCRLSLALSGPVPPPPQLNGSEDAETRAAIQSMRDYRIVGPDAVRTADASCGQLARESSELGTQINGQSSSVLGGMEGVWAALRSSRRSNYGDRIRDHWFRIDGRPATFERLVGLLVDEVHGHRDAGAPRNRGHITVR